MKNPLTAAGIEPATFRCVAQHLHHCATAVHTKLGRKVNIYLEREKKLQRITNLKKADK